MHAGPTYVRVPGAQTIPLHICRGKMALQRRKGERVSLLVRRQPEPEEGISTSRGGGGGHVIGRRERDSGDCGDCEAEALSGDRDVGGGDTEDSESGDVMTGQCWQ